MNAYNIIDACSQSFFALLGIWAAVDRRHWFVRFIIVTGILLVALLIPAYEVVIEFGLQMTLIMAGVWLARGERKWPPRLSLETALLTTVVVAVTAAVIAHVPNLQPGVWAFMLNVGICTALFSLLAMWIVFGKMRLHWRLLLALPGLALFILIYHFGASVEHMLWRTSGSPNWLALQEFYTKPQMSWWMSRQLPTIALAAPVMLGVLWLARESQWFTAPPDRTWNSSLPRHALAARVGLCGMAVIIVAPLVFLFYQLMTPPSLSLVAKPPSPNGFDDFVAAGELTPLSIQTAARTSLGRTGLKQLFADLEPVADRIERGLQKKCLTPLDDATAWGGVNVEESLALDRAAAAVWVRAEYLRQYGSMDEQIAELLKLLRLEQEASQGSVRVWEGIGYWQDSVTPRLWSIIHRLNIQQLRDLTGQLQKLDGAREPFEAKVRRQSIFDQNAQWTNRVTAVLDEWSGKIPYDDYHATEKQRMANKRLLIAHLAAKAFLLERNRAPHSLDELVPEYLTAVPRDPYIDGPLKFRREGPRYVIYSVGPDGIEDYDAPATRSHRDDNSVAGPHHPSLWTQLRDWAAIGWEKFEQHMHREGEAPAEP